MRTLIPEWTEYELLDSGSGKKLERFGKFTLTRPEAQATWKPSLPERRWQAAEAEFVQSGRQGRWNFRNSIPTRWMMRRENLKFWVQPSPSGHVGVFPDQASHWDWIADVVTRAATTVQLLCLFGHTGLATLSAAATGAEVTHVDASRKAVALARENQALSGMNDRPVRWIVEDALTFVKREARRGNRYSAILLDPPTFGRGPDGEIWKLRDSLPELLATCRNILSPSPLFVLLSIYTTVRTQLHIEKEAEKLHLLLQKTLAEFRLQITAGELALEDGGRRRIHTSVFARAESVDSR